MGESGIRKVIIVGGGTAGWMTAAFLSQSLGGSIDIQLIESDEIGIVGVGEATIPPILNFNRALDIDEDEFVRATQATFKLGIQFRNWGAIGDSYIHGFGKMGHSTGVVDFAHFWLKMRQAGKVGRIDDYAINLLACEKNKFLRATGEYENSPLKDIGHAFHFDAGLYAKFLRGYAEKHGVMRTEGKISSVQQHPETGFVASVTLEDGSTHAAELFVDCSGFRGLLIEQTLHTGYDDWSHWLPCNRALAVPCRSVSPLTPYTRSTAHAAGWQWRIPLQSRIGNGHVYCSEYMSDDEAASILMGNLDGEALAEPRLLRFVTGKRKQFWNRNVVAIGLSSGFMEPLESTSIHLIQKAIARLVSFFPGRDFSQVDIDEFNRQSQVEFERIRDFIILHYHATRRSDSAFWNYCRTMPIPDTLRDKIELFRSNGRICQDPSDLFSEISWFQVMFGQGIHPLRYHALVDAKSDELVLRMLADVKRVMHGVVDLMPSHEDFIAKHCKADPIE
ncbi:tryptophan halogenase [Pseudoxanthomonas kalamensis DSM 18571]|uniref:tryptophan halogenase family protein n=1 Tax=Pseudoxanthomonas kalamensis TaxID=289483 RepID=UPI001391F5C2|nr:tryptophan halogenase family protein [Pseudoxanthomonas kalamensis]KAF1710391.1 tryptophan halogenase [Pseudoxanthomonas kalamensis DSM 18571]